jgi:4-hydroxy-tetrahydrodipicolinate synthase
VKYALSLLGRMDDRVRLPLVGITDTTKTAIRGALAHAGLIN